MGEIIHRKTQPSCFQHILKLFHRNDSENNAVPFQDIVEYLIEQEYEKDLARKTVEGAIADGLIISRGRSSSKELLCLPKLKNIEVPSHDSYCFECHLPGELQPCRECSHAFHEHCCREDPFKPLYTIPQPSLGAQYNTDFITKSTLVDQSTEVTTSSNNNGNNGNWEPPSPSKWTQQDLETIFENISDSELSNMEESWADSTVYTEDDFLIGNVDTKTDVDVVYIGEVRAPLRRTQVNASIDNTFKNETYENVDDIESEKYLCTCCRLKKLSHLHSPPNMESNQLSCLIGYSFDRNRSWLNTDIASYLNTLKCSETEKKIVTQLLCLGDVLSLHTIDKRIRTRRYSYLMEFLIDILKLQHSVGVFFGHLQLEATMYLVRDTTYEVLEILRCPDCFRFSNMKHLPFWFARPCYSRHELVYAKYRSYPYWPAKVIQVVPTNKYDVRFFGGRYSRALIDINNIRPIETNLQTLNKGTKTRRNLKMALHELGIHQILLKYPRDKFSFSADKTEMENIVRQAHETYAQCNNVEPVVQKQKEILLNGTHVMLRRFAKRSHRDLDNTQQLFGTSEADTQVNNIDPTVQQENRLSLVGTHIMKRRSSKRCHPDSENMQDLPTTSETQRQLNNGGTGQGVNVAKRRALERSYPDLENIEQLPESREVSVNNLNNTKILHQINNDVGLSKESSEDMKRQIHQLQKRVNELEQKEKQVSILKRKIWCHWCLEEANFICCLKGAYCSRECRNLHMKNGHKNECTNSV